MTDNIAYDLRTSLPSLAAANGVLDVAAANLVIVSAASAITTNSTQ